MHPRASTEAPRASTIRLLALVLLSVAGATIGLQIAATGPLRESFWGFHLYGFLPRPIAFAAWAVLGLASAALAARLFTHPPVPSGAGAAAPPGRPHPVWIPVLFALICAAVFWGLRSEQTLLGDAEAILVSVPDGDHFHPRQPFAVAAQGWVYETLGSLYRTDSTPDRDVARFTVALGNVLFGFLFALAAWGLGRSVAGLAAADGPVVPWLVTLLLLTQGYTVLFYGYIENYAAHALVIAVYLWLALRYLGGRASLTVVAAVAVGSLGVHMSSLTLLPSFAFLAAVGLARRERRRDALLGIGVAVLAAVLLDLVFRSLAPGYSLPAAVREISRAASKPAAGLATGLDYTVSPAHLRDFANDQFLIGPFGAYLMVPALALLAWRAARGAARARSPAAGFLAVASLTPLAGSFLTSEPLLGYPRDWDMFAAAGVAYTAAAAAFTVILVRDARPLRWLLGFAVVFSLLQLAPFVALNRDEARSVERFKTLPLGRGRTPVVVGNYYLRSGDLDEAERWLRRAIEENPGNATAHAFLALVLVRQGRPAEALRGYEAAILRHPDNRAYRVNHSSLAMREGQYARALPHVRWLTERFPGEVEHWRALARIAEETGDAEEYRRAKEHLLALLEQRVREEPRNAGALHALGEALRGLGRRPEALERFRAALAIDPGSKDALIDIARLLLEMGREEEARAYVERLEALYPLVEDPRQP